MIAPDCRLIVLNVNSKIVANQLKIKRYGIKNLFGWIPGKRRHRWILFDEIKVY